MIDRNMFGEILHELREDYGITFSEYCRCVGVSKSFASRVEVGHKKIPDTYVKKAIRFFTNLGYHVPELEILATASCLTFPMASLNSDTQKLIIAKIFHAKMTEKELDMLDIIITEFFKYREYTKEVTNQKRKKSRGINNEEQIET